MDWRSTHWVWHAHCTWSSCSLFSTKGPKGWKEQRKIKQKGIQQKRGEKKQLLIYNYYSGPDSIVVPTWPLWKSKQAKLPVVFKTLETFFLATINSPLTRPQFNSESYLKMCKSCKTDAIKFRYRWYFNFWVFPAISLILAKALFASSNFLGCRSSAQMVCCFTLVLIIETILIVCKISDLWDRSLSFDVVIMTTTRAPVVLIMEIWGWLE